MAVRKNAFTLGEDAQREFVRAFERNKAVVSKTASAHTQLARYKMHGTMGGVSGDPLGAARFLGWHRALLLDVERALGCAIPYWDWTRGTLPQWVKDWSDGRGGHWVGRFADAFDPSYMPPLWSIRGVQKRTDYKSFSDQVEVRLHNNGHSAMGGVMLTMRSPASPMFYLHHSEVDRQWAGWQRRYPKERPLLEAPWDVMSPYNDTIDSLMDLRARGVHYDVLPP